MTTGEAMSLRRCEMGHEVPIMGHIVTQMLRMEVLVTPLTKSIVISFRWSSKWTELVVWCHKGRSMSIVALQRYVSFEICIKYILYVRNRSGT